MQRIVVTNKEPQNIGLKNKAPQKVTLENAQQIIIGAEFYNGEYTVAPNFESQKLITQGKTMREDVTVNPIEVARVSNQSGGKTIFIGGITIG